MWDSTGWSEGCGGGSGGEIDPSVLQPYIDKCKVEVTKATKASTDSQGFSDNAKISADSSKLSADEALAALEELKKLIEGFDPGTGGEPGGPGGDIDLSKYYTKKEIDVLLTEIRKAIADLPPGGSGGTPTDLSDYYKKKEVNNLINTLEAKISNIGKYELPAALKNITMDKEGNPLWGGLTWPSTEITEEDTGAARALINDLTTSVVTTWSSVKINDVVKDAIRSVKLTAVELEKVERQFNFFSSEEVFKDVFRLESIETELDKVVHAGSLTMVNSSTDAFVVIKIYDYDIEIMSTQLNPGETQQYNFNLVSHRFTVTAAGSGTVHAVFQIG